MRSSSPESPAEVRWAVATGASDAASRRGRGRTLLRGLVGDLAGVDAALVSITATCPDCGRHDHGRPIAGVPTGARRVWVSLSHAGGTTVAAATTAGPVGVDAEPADLPQDRRIDVGRMLSLAPGVDALRAWTRVEAVLKADGRGLRVDPAAVVVDRRDGILVARIADEPDRYLVEDLPVRDDLVVSLARRMP